MAPGDGLFRPHPGESRRHHPAQELHAEPGIRIPISARRTRAGYTAHP